MSTLLIFFSIALSQMFTTIYKLGFNMGSKISGRQTSSHSGMAQLENDWLTKGSIISKN